MVKFRPNSSLVVEISIKQQEGEFSSKGHVRFSPVKRGDPLRLLIDWILT